MAKLALFIEVSVKNKYFFLIFYFLFMKDLPVY